jgi:hypothetical protein
VGDIRRRGGLGATAPEEESFLTTLLQPIDFELTRERVESY